MDEDSATLRSRHVWRLRLFAVAIGVVSSWIMAELILRVPGLPLPMLLRNRLFGCFGVQAEHQRAWFLEPQLAVPLLKPDFAATCFGNGRRWHHEGDRWGFRNPRTWEQVEIALLGDSFVYGQGIEEDDTIARRLRDELGVRVANLGIIATCPVHYLAYFRNFALRLQPKVVVLLLFANDLDDMVAARTEDQLRSFVDGGAVPELGIYTRESLMAEAPPQPKTFALERLAGTSLVYQTLRFYVPRMEEKLGWQWRRVFSGDTVNPDDRLRRFPPEVPLLAVVSGYVRRAIRSMATSAHENGASLVLGFIPTAGASGRNRVLTALLSDIASTDELPYLDLTPALTDGGGAPLPGTRFDGDLHLTPAGNERVASALASFLDVHHVEFRR